AVEKNLHDRGNFPGSLPVFLFCRGPSRIYQCAKRAAGDLLDQQLRALRARMRERARDSRSLSPQSRPRSVNIGRSRFLEDHFIESDYSAYHLTSRKNLGDGPFVAVSIVQLLIWPLAGNELRLLHVSGGVRFVACWMKTFWCPPQDI